MAHLFLLLAYCQVNSQPKEVREFFSLCDKLGLQSELKKPFVKVREIYEGKPGAIQKVAGILKSETKTDFIIILPSLAPRRFPKVPDKKRGPRFDYQPADLAKWVKNTAAATNPNTLPDYKDTFFSIDEYLYLDYNFPSMAYICSQRGMTGETAFFIYYCKKNGALRPYSVREALEMSDRALDEIMRQFEDLKQSRSDLLDKLKKTAPTYQGYPGYNKFVKATATLQRMVREDESHTPNSDPIKEKIWKLRDQEVDMVWNRGALEKLVEIGLPAVPALIDAIKDTSYTRSQYQYSKGFYVDFQEDNNVRVGDAAYKAIKEIACREFNVRSRQQGEQAARKWYAEVMAKGEKAVLIKGVKAGGPYADRQARRLVKAYPDAAFAAIKEGLINAPYYVRPNLLRAIKELKQPREIEFIQQIMLHGGDIRTRISAAKLLATTNSDTVLEAMFKEWTNLSEEDSVLVSRDLVECFMAARSRKYLKKIQQDFRNRRVSERHDFIVMGDWSSSKDWKLGAPSLDPDWEIAMEDFLASELDDDVRCGTVYLFHQGHEPLLSELAASYLCNRFPHTYKFERAILDDDLKDLRAELLKIYRSRR